MKDLSFWKEYEGTSEGSGQSEKIWLQNPNTGQTGLFKFKKDAGTTDHISECIAYKIAKLLKLPCTKFELGMCRGREGSINYNIIEEPTQNLTEGIYFITLIYPGYSPGKFIDTSTQHRYSIETIKKPIEQFVPINDFLKMLIFNYLVGNSNRHQNSWAILLEENQMTWSPLYDNSPSSYTHISEDQVKNYLGRDKNRWKALVDTESEPLLYCDVYDEKHPTCLNVLKYIKENYFTETREFAKKVSTAMLGGQIRDTLKQYSTAESSGNKKRLIFESLLTKKQMLEEVCMGGDE